MKLIIDIPDNWEKELNQSKIIFADIVDIDTIRNGIPLDKIRAEIKQAADKQFQIAMGVTDLIERYAHIRMENAYRHSMSIIDRYKVERSE